MSRLRRVAVAALVALAAGGARAEAPRDRFDSGGYLRLGARPDLQGGNGKLGYWNLYGRLLNEGTWSALEMKLDLLQPDTRGTRPWTSLRARIEGGSVRSADSLRGVLSSFALHQLYVQAGNLPWSNVTWQVGSIDWYLGDLGLYDMRLAQILFETVGVSARIQTDKVDLFVGLGDSGFFLRGEQYNTILTGAALARVRLGKNLEIGGGFQLMYEPMVKGNRFAPHATPDLAYENFARGEVVRRYLEKHPEQTDYFPQPAPTSASSGKVMGYLGFGGFGPVLWNNFFINYLRGHPEQFYEETFRDRKYTIYVKELTDERWQLNLGNELRLAIIPNKLDVAWGVLAGLHWDDDNTVKPGDNNRRFASTVLRAQTYLTETLHLLAETSYAYEESTNGNLFRNHADSIFTNTGGVSDPRGFEYGDSAVRRTWQGKIGPVLSPLGTGIYTRPSLRLLYGVQHSTQNNAWGNAFVESLAEQNAFQNEERHWHHVFAAEVEAWF